MRESSQADERLTAAAVDLMRALQHSAPLPAPPAAVRDLTLGQMRLLFVLRHEGPQPMGRIAEMFDLTPAASSGFVSRIQRQGLVERHHRSEDRRVVECDLTEDGRRFMDGVSGVRVESVKAALGTLSPTELSEFHRLVDRIRERQGRPA